MSTLNPKRIILILGGKGGTGKTLYCRMLYYFLIQAGVNCLAYDADIENPEFEEYHTESLFTVQGLDFLDVGDAKRFFTELDQHQPDVTLLDLPGASGKQMREQIQRFGLFNIAEKLGYRVTIATVLNNGYNTINSLDMMLEFCGSRADYVGVKSQLWNQGSLNFERWEKSATRTQFLALKGIETEMPILDGSTFDAMHEESVSFFEAGKLPFGDRILVESFLDLSRPQIEAAAPYLGYPVGGQGQGQGTVPKTVKRKQTVEAGVTAE